MSNKRKFLLIATAIVAILGLAVGWMAVHERAQIAHVRKELKEIRRLIEGAVSKHEGQKTDADTGKTGSGPQVPTKTPAASDK
jgi:hypothetical protein